MFCRQSGKTETIVRTVEVLLIYFCAMFGRPIRIGIFAPQREQAKTDFDRLKKALERPVVMNEFGLTFPESNQTTLNVFCRNANGESEENGYCYVFPITANSHPESKTLDMAIYEEAQKIDDEERENKVDPMLASTNGAKIFVGTEGYKMRYFLRLMDEAEASGGRYVKADYHQIILEKRSLYRATGDEKHLNYEKYMAKEIKKGEDRPSFKVQYALIRQSEIGTFANRGMLRNIFVNEPFYYDGKVGRHLVGIDYAKSTDKTVASIGRIVRRTKTDENGNEVVYEALQFINALEFRGTDYDDQIEQIIDTLEKFEVEGIANDSTGVGDPVVDFLVKKTHIRPIYRVAFTLKSKDIMYRLLEKMIRNGTFLLPDPESDKLNEAEKRVMTTLISEVLELEVEYKGQNEQFRSVSHPDKDGAHDDYPDSLALLVYAYDKLYGHRTRLYESNTLN